MHMLNSDYNEYKVVVNKRCKKSSDSTINFTKDALKAGFFIYNSGIPCPIFFRRKNSRTKKEKYQIYDKEVIAINTIQLDLNEAQEAN